MKRLYPLAGLALLVLSPLVQADTINVSTGLDASNTLITDESADAHWTAPSGAAALPVFADDADGGFFTWVANGPNSNWIAADDNNASDPGNDGTYTRTFDLTALDQSTASISGSWTLDDEGTLNLNGHQIAAALVSGDWTSLHPFSDSNSADFNVGLNTLTIVLSGDNFLDAVRLEGNVTTSAVPEPTSLALLAIGMTGLVGYARRRPKQAAAC
jgi:hypothetical protein